MRIGLVIYGDIDSLSGGNRYDRRLVEYLRNNGNEVDIFSLKDRGYLLNLYAGWFLEPQIRLWNKRFDLLLVDELTHSQMGWMIDPIRRRHACPILSIVHHLMSDEPRSTWRNWLIRRAEKMFLATVDGHICNTGVTARRVSSLDHRPTPVFTALPGVFIDQPLPTLEEIKERVERTTPLHILLVGNITRRKGVLPLLEALEKGSLPEWRLTLVGRTDMEPAYVEKVRNKINASGMEERVALTGPLEGEMLGQVYRSADLFVMPSTYEGFGIAYLEAMAYGLPVIAGNAGGAVEIVRDSINGFLVPPGDREILTARLEQLSADPALRLRLGLEARATFDRHPTWEKSFAGVKQFLEEMTR